MQAVLQGGSGLLAVSLAWVLRYVSRIARHDLHVLGLFHLEAFTPEDKTVWRWKGSDGSMRFDPETATAHDRLSVQRMIQHLNATQLQALLRVITKKRGTAGARASSVP